MSSVFASHSRWERRYASQLEFYRDAYGQHITDVLSVGSIGATLIGAVQSAGDWSDAPTPDLLIGWLPTAPVGIKLDLGAGRFEGMQRTGDAVLIAPHAGSSIEMQAAHGCRALAVPYSRILNFLGDDDTRLPPSGDFGRLHAGLLRDPVLTNLLDHLWLEASEGGPHGMLYADGCTLQIAAVLLRLSHGEPKRRAIGGLAPYQLKRVIDHIENRLSEGSSLEELASLVGLSASHFAVAFRRSTGLPPHAWQTQRRVERAKTLLTSTKMSIAEIAVECGFSHAQHLARQFRRATGSAPSSYRRARVT
jgi:AraC family transcriptional regulator